MENSQEEWDVEMRRLLDKHFGQAWKDHEERIVEFIDMQVERLSANDYNELFLAYM